MTDPGPPQYVQSVPPDSAGDGRNGDAVDRVAAENDTTPVVTTTRSREELTVRTERYPYRRVRMGKRIVTEEHTITVTLRREESVVDDEPITHDSMAHCGLHPDGFVSADDNRIDMVLHAERVVIGTEVIPVERVCARIVEVTDTVEVTEPVQHEHVAVWTDR